MNGIDYPVFLPYHALLEIYVPTAMTNNYHRYSRAFIKWKMMSKIISKKLTLLKSLLASQALSLNNNRNNRMIPVLEEEIFDYNGVYD